MTSQQQFDRQAAHYNQQWADWNRESLRWLIEHSGAQPHHRLLDVATGAGYTAQGFAPLVGEVIGVDVSEGMLEQARAKNMPNARFERAPAERLPFPDARFDLVVSRIAPHHFDSVPDFLAEARRVLVPGGRLLIGDTVVPDNDPELDTWQNTIEKLRDPSHVRNYSPSEWHAMAAAAGFTVEESSHEGGQIGITMEDWLTKAGCTGEAAARVRQMFREAPARAVRTFALQPLANGDYAFAWLRLVLAARVS